jgi:glycine/D-amino acid oxidase-like deaminating enzyme
MSSVNQPHDPHGIAMGVGLNLSSNDLGFNAEPTTKVSCPLRLDRPGLDHAPSFWAATAGEEVATSNELMSRKETSVAIIGGGFTGLSCAYHLAKKFGIKATVLEANKVGWGASGRNGGFAMICVGKDDYADTVAQYGLEEAKQQFDVGFCAVKTVEDIVRENNIDVERAEYGWINIAHKASRIDGLKATQRLLKKSFDYDTEFVDEQSLRQDLIGSTEAHGGLIYPDGFGLHPLKYARGMAKAAMDHGATIHDQSPVLSWTKEGGRHVLRTPRGTLVADHVVIATAGYTLDSMNPWLAGRVLSAISNIAVTRPLTPEEQIRAGLKTTMMVSDTRKLVFYYRLLPDGRLLFGARGGIRDDGSQNKQAYDWLIKRMVDMFPSLASVKVEYFWRGWVCLSRDKHPHMGTTDDPTVHYSIAYMGNGVALASHFGRLVAAQIAGQPEAPKITLFKKTLPRFELPSLRETQLRAAYAYYGIKDRFL